MALTTLEATTITRAVVVARKLLDEIKPVLDALNIIYDSDDGVKETVTQGDLDDTPSLSGLTETQLDDALYVLTNNIRTALASGYTQLAHLAARG